MIADIQRMEIHVRRIVQYVEQWWHEMDEQEHVMLIMHRHEHVVQRREHVMMEQHHEVMDILTVMHDVRNHGIMNIYNIIQALQHGIIHHQRVQQCVPHRQEHVMLVTHRHELVFRRRENVQTEQHHELMDILIVTHDVRSHGIMNI